MLEHFNVTREKDFLRCAKDMSIKCLSYSLSRKRSHGGQREGRKNLSKYIPCGLKTQL